MSRKTLDQYYTEDALARAICARIAADEPGIAESRSNGTGPSILEPSAGQGAFVHAAFAQWPRAWIDAVEISEGNIEEIRRAGAHGVFQRDFLTFDRKPVSPGALYQDGPVKPVGYDLIVGNPPYASAQAHIEHALPLLAPTGVAYFLLRLGLIATRRFAPLTPKLAGLIPLTPRPSFTGGGSDMTEYALFVFAASHEGHGEILPPLVWREKGSAKRGLFSVIFGSADDDV
jgi:hypothetical protein